MKLLNLLTRLLCTAISMLSGVLGYSWAVKNAPSETEFFVQAGLLSLIIQTLLISIASNHKSRLLNGWKVGQIHLRSSISIAISASCTVIFAILTFIIWYTTSEQKLFFFVTLFLLAFTLQLLSFTASSQQQVVDLARFWRFQLIGAVTRLAAVIVLVVGFNLSFLGVLISNAFAAATIALLYRNLRFNLTDLIRDLRLAITYNRSLLRLDGILRAFRLSYEQQLMMAFIVVSDFAFLHENNKSEAAYTSTGFLNAEATALRQVFASSERENFLGEKSSGRFAIISIICQIVALLLWNFESFTEQHLLILPDLENGGTRTILRALAVYVALYPLTLGFAFADYLPTSQVRLLAFSLAISTSILLCLAAAFQSLWTGEQLSKEVWPLWAAAPGFTIGLSFSYLRWRKKMQTKSA
ncbi:hypothetical protein [Donghicola tyrosinivorans]|uniref:Uncharacterized protein n=1 Tax=Donghicola tyrosinivorans TaxID=1652492 RepID=A0A2T0WDD2_9RHOB|nr:hypothetical protein [Donghicola tyrosinivorans]PRY84720.1 hypothetical protein CLV74_12152 [Donghicola tyrosinivorans]